MAAEDVEVVMASASMLEQAGEELARVIKNRDRIMRNRNNKQEELRELREKFGELQAMVRGRDTNTDHTAKLVAVILSR